MSERVCPFWIGYILASPVRKLIQNPSKILSPYIRHDFTVLDVGTAMGYFSLPMAEMVKPNGKVICVDMQQKMLNVLRKKAGKAGLSDRIETVLCSQDSLNLEAFTGKVDFALLFAVLHEVPGQARCFQQISKALKTGGLLLFSEPAGHVSLSAFWESVSLAEKNNFKVIEHPKIKRSHSVLFEKF